MFNIESDQEFLQYCNIAQLYSMNIFLGSILLGNLRSFVFAEVILKYFGAAHQEAAQPPSAPPYQDV